LAFIPLELLPIHQAKYEKDTAVSEEGYLNYLYQHFGKSHLRVSDTLISVVNR